MMISRHLAVAASMLVVPIGAASQAAAPGYTASVAFMGTGIVRSNFVECYNDFHLEQQVCLDASNFSLPSPGQHVTIAGSYTPISSQIPLLGDYGSEMEGNSFQFLATPTDGSASFYYSRKSYGSTISFHNGRIASLTGYGITYDDCGFDTAVSFAAAAMPWPGRFQSSYCAYIYNVQPHYGVVGDWRVTAYSYDGGPWIPVPEPAHWAMLITGIGIVGAAMRRHRQLLKHRCYCGPPSQTIASTLLPSGSRTKAP